MMRNEAMRGMPRGRRPGSRYVPSPFMQELMGFKNKMWGLDAETRRLGLDAESEPTQHDPLDDTSEESADTVPTGDEREEPMDDTSEESADTISTGDDQESSDMPFECYGCGKKMENWVDAVRTYSGNYHYCQGCIENGTMEEKEREHQEALMEDLERWSESIRKDLEGD